MKTYNKLIRDRIPEIMEARGVKFKTSILSQDDYKNELLNKLVEESREVLAANTDRSELIKELGDVFEVIDYLIIAFGLDSEEIGAVKAERKESRGGFTERVFLEYTE
ncbi:MAG TPA: nucleoside triphosphate pyrophosphohydrolase [bacterium]|jgi:predicted house-cleaning noncanonical NTP pyrophosphatase (MazG superfamily)|nr:nucleoside triphosphate pyrophosphohydrolase [bacterium]HPL22220.1 nucleoside triphosphate pyrophosphohydrolase [bacterium]